MNSSIEMKSTIGFCFVFSLVGFGLMLSAQAQTKSAVWLLNVTKSVEELRLPATVVGGEWNAPPAFLVPDLNDLKKLPPKFQKHAAALAEEYQSKGVDSVADFSLLTGGLPVGSISIRLLIFEDSQKCKAWWDKEYQYDGWKKDFKGIETLENANCVESKKSTQRAIAFGNVGITGRQHSRGDKTEYIVAMKSLVLELMEGAKSQPMAQPKNDASPAASGDLPKIVGATTDATNGWNVFRGDARSSGASSTSLPKDLEVYWEFKVPKGAFEGTAVIAQNPDSLEQTAYIGDLDGMLFAFDLETGRKKWEYKTPISFSASPAYRDGRVFIGDIDGVFYCVSSEGKELWKYETGGEISSSANFFDGHVLVGSQDGHLYLLNAETGKLIWKHQTPDQIRCSATVAGDRAFVAGCDGFLHVINLNDGKEVGSVNIKSPTGSTPAVYGDSVFFGTEQAEFLAVDWKTVKDVWQFSDDKGQAAVRGCAAVNKDHVIFGARNRQVYSLNPVTGDVNWAVTLKAKVDSSPIIAGDRVYVGSTDGRFYVLSLKDGKTIWEKQFNGGFISSPAAAFGKLVIATDRGVVYCLGKKK